MYLIRNKNIHFGGETKGKIKQTNLVVGRTYHFVLKEKSHSICNSFRWLFFKGLWSNVDLSIFIF